LEVKIQTHAARLACPRTIATLGFSPKRGRFLPIDRAYAGLFTALLRFGRSGLPTVWISAHRAVSSTSVIGHWQAMRSALRIRDIRRDDTSAEFFGGAPRILAGFE